MNQCLSLQNLVREAGEDEFESALPVAAGTPRARAGSGLQSVKVPSSRPKKIIGDGDKAFANILFWASSMLMHAKKTTSFVVSASYMTQEDSSRIPIGGAASSTEVTFLNIAKFLQVKDLGELIIEMIPRTIPKDNAHGLKHTGDKRYFFKFVDFRPVVALSADKQEALGSIALKLAPFRLNYQDYTERMTELVDFAALRAKGIKGAGHARNAMTLAQLFPKLPSALPLDATEPRLETELGHADNLMAASSSSYQGSFQEFNVLAAGPFF